MKLSIVATMYHSNEFIEEFCQRVIRSLEDISLPKEQYEIILVDDGCPSDSWKVAQGLKWSCSSLKVVRLSRNVGHHSAMMVGLELVAGDYIFLTDIDLEEAPENLTIFYKALEELSDVDCVYGSLVEEKKRVSSTIFYWFFDRLSSIPIPRNYLVSRMFTSRYNSELIRHKEKEIFIPALWSLAGFNQVSIPISKKMKGQTTYSLSKRVSLAVNAITSCSSKPLHYIFYLGSMMALGSFGITCWIIFSKFFLMEPLPGWTSLIVSIYLVGGVVLMSLGVIGIYISKIFNETKNRPYDLIKEIV